MFLWPGRWLGEAGGIRVVLEKVTGHVPDGAEVRQRTVGRPKDDGIIPLFDQDFRALEAKRLRQADGLAAPMLEDFCGYPIYIVYLCQRGVNPQEFR